jgi:Methyltransferase domain
LSATLIARAQQRAAAGETNVSFRVGDAYDLPFPDASFDRVVARRCATDPELGRRFTHLLCDQMHNGRIVRELPWQLARHGFTHVTVTPQVRLSREPGAAHEWLIEPVTHELVRIGAITSGDGARLLDDLRERADTGRYFLARTYYSVIATAA